MQHKILKTGHSLCVTIPANFAQVLGLKPGQPVKAEVNMLDQTLTYKFTSVGQLTLLPSSK